jgi:hypothetical protein
MDVAYGASPSETRRSLHSLTNGATVAEFGSNEVTELADLSVVDGVRCGCGYASAALYVAVDESHALINTVCHS